MIDALEERRAKEHQRRVFETHVVAFMPASEWWPEIPWYPGSRPAKDDISVTEEVVAGDLVRTEALALTCSATVASVMEWYAGEMPKLKWTLRLEDSRLDQKGVPDHRWLSFSDATGQVRVEIQVRELGKHPSVPTEGSPEVRGFHALIQQKTDQYDQQATKRTGPATTYLSLSRSERYEATLRT